LKIAILHAKNPQGGVTTHLRLDL